MSGAYFLAAAEEDRKRKRVRINKRVLSARASPAELPDAEFLRLFRVTKPLFRQLCAELTPLLPGRQYANAIPADVKVGSLVTSDSVVRAAAAGGWRAIDYKILTALAFYGCGDYQKAVGGALLGLSQTSVHDCLRDVTNALNAPAVLRKYIRFPRTAQELEEVSRGFYRASGVPGAAGCVGAAHVALIRPCENEGAYFNTKNYHSINVLIICDSALNVLYVDASFGGACPAAHVWAQCPVRAFLQARHARGDGAHYLLGDSAYPQRAWLMTPAPRAAAGSPEEHYNALHAHALRAVRRCLGALRARWRCLLPHKVLRYSPVKAGKMVNACVVLHNLATRAGLAAASPEPPPEPPQRGEAPQCLEAAERLDEDGSRRALVARLWAARPAGMYRADYDGHCQANQYYT